MLGMGRASPLEVYEHSRVAMLTYDAAVQQQRHSVACILVVVAAECLTVPNTEWRHAKLTARFIRYFEDMMPDDLDVIVQHGNFEEAFGIRRGAKRQRALRVEFLDRIYDYRSGQVHEGLTPSYRAFPLGHDVGEEARRGLIADFTEGAILNYLAAVS